MPLEEITSGDKVNGAEIQECLNQFRSLVANEEILKEERTDDAYLLRYLTCTNYDPRAAFTRMKQYTAFKKEHSEWFVSGSALKYKELVEENYKLMLLDRDNDGRRIYLTTVEHIDTNKYTFEDLVQLDDLWLEAVMDEPETQKNGVSVIMDMTGYSFRVFRWLTPSNLKLGSQKVELFPCKEFVYHIVNTSTLLNLAIKIAWPFLTAKTKEHIKFHYDDWPSLHKFISPSVLPPEYGGTGPPLNYEKINQFLFDKHEEVAKALK